MGKTYFTMSILSSTYIWVSFRPLSFLKSAGGMRKKDWNMDFVLSWSFWTVYSSIGFILFYMKSCLKWKGFFAMEVKDFRATVDPMEYLMWRLWSWSYSLLSILNICNFYLSEFLFHLAIDVCDVDFESVSLIEVIFEWSCFLKSFSYCIVKFLKCNIGSFGQTGVNVVGLRWSFFHEEKWNVSDSAIVNKVFEWIGPK